MTAAQDASRFIVDGRSDARAMLKEALRCLDDGFPNSEDRALTEADCAVIALDRVIARRNDFAILAKHSEG